MSSEKYVWTLGSDPPILESHSLAKHEVIAAYISRYFDILAANPRIPQISIDIVDGFSGGGEYILENSKEIVPGSPLILLSSIAASELKLGADRDKGFTIRTNYYFIDHSGASVEYLEDTSSRNGFGERLERDIFCLNAKFVDVCDRVVERISKRSRSARSIFILDQYGYKDVPFEKIRLIFQKLPSAEILLTFAADALIDYINESEQYRGTLRAIGLDQILDDPEAFKNKTIGWRYVIESRLSDAMRSSSGARFFTPFFIVSSKSHRAYWFVHLCMHQRAHDEIVKIHWELQNHFKHYGKPGLRMLGYDPDKDGELTGKLEFDFGNFARDQSRNALVTDLADLIFDFEDGIGFQQLLEATFNDTPASSDIYKDALELLAKEGDIVVETQKGGFRRSMNNVKAQDIIRPNRQLRLFSVRRQ